MNQPASQPAMFCDRCGGVISVYEPVIVVINGRTRETSQAAEPQIVFGVAVRYHRDCYHALTGPQTD